MSEREYMISPEERKIFCVIPARKNSKRVKGKNKRLFRGKPLFEHALKAAVDSNVFRMIVVSSDDMEILEYVYEHYFGAESIVQPHNRPRGLCLDETPLRAVLRLIAVTYKAGEELCLIQPTNPLITSDEISKAYDKFRETDCNYLIGMNNGKDIGFHIMKTKAFFNEYEMDFFGSKWISFQMDGVDIDTEEDFRRAE